MKVASGAETAKHEVTREAAALEWLRGTISPQLLWFGEVEGRLALVTEALAGVALHEAPDPAIGAVAAIRTLAALHALPVETCPFDERLDVKLATARRRAQAGAVDAADFDAERQGRDVMELYAELVAKRPSSEDLVVTHGDACWPNFVVAADGTAAIIDLGRFGVADRYQDLALLLRSGVYNAPAVDGRSLLAKHYPITDLDEEKLAYFQLLDEFF